MELPEQLAAPTEATVGVVGGGGPGLAAWGLQSDPRWVQLLKTWGQEYFFLMLTNERTSRIHHACL